MYVNVHMCMYVNVYVHMFVRHVTHPKGGAAFPPFPEARQDALVGPRMPNTTHQSCRQTLPSEHARMRDKKRMCQLDGRD